MPLISTVMAVILFGQVAPLPRQAPSAAPARIEPAIATGGAIAGEIPAGAAQRGTIPPQGLPLKPAELTAEILLPRSAATLAGRPLPLATAIASTADRRQQLEITHAYWRLAAAVADFHLAWDHERQLRQWKPRAEDATLFAAATASATAMLHEGELAAVAAQHDLAAACGIAIEALPLPADRPHVGAYRTNYAELAAMGAIPPRGRLLDQVLPLRRRAIEIRTEAVGEFPELQGIMGRYYALHDGLPGEIADAIEDHYKPRFAGDALPRGNVGLCVALADKLETLAGMFGIGQLPTGDKDPFALRRHALGVIRMLIEQDLPLELDWLFRAAQATDAKVAGQLADFITERLAGSLREQGYSALEVDAVVSLRPQRLGDIPKRLAAVRAFAALPEAASLAAANKRVGNILKKAESAVAARVDGALFKEEAERALFAALNAVQPKADAAFAAGDYAASLQALAALKAPVDAFFDTVMVNAEDAALRNNRLGLLAILHQAMNRVADLSRLSA